MGYECTLTLELLTRNYVYSACFHSSFLCRGIFYQMSPKWLIL